MESIKNRVDRRRGCRAVRVCFLDRLVLKSYFLILHNQRHLNRLGVELGLGKFLLNLLDLPIGTASPRRAIGLGFKRFEFGRGNLLAHIPLSFRPLLLLPGGSGRPAPWRPLPTSFVDGGDLDADHLLGDQEFGPIQSHLGQNLLGAGFQPGRGNSRLLAGLQKADPSPEQAAPSDCRSSQLQRPWNRHRA